MPTNVITALLHVPAGVSNGVVGPTNGAAAPTGVGAAETVV